MDQLKENETNRGIEFYFKETFTATYFKQFQSIKSTTIEALVSNGYEDKNSLLALDLIHDLPLIQSINLAQKSLLRKALEKLKCEELGEHEMNNKRNRRSFDQNNANSKMIKTGNSDRKIATKKQSLESWYSFEALDSKHEEIERSTQLAEIDSTENSIPSLSMPRIINSRNASKPQRIQSKTLNMSEQNRAIIYKSKHWSEKNIRNSFTESKKEIEKPVTNKSVYKIGYITSRLEVQNLEKLAISLKSINNEFHDSVFKDAMKFLDIKQKIKLESVCKSFQTISNQTLREQDVIILKGCSMNGSEKTETTDHCLKYSRHLSHSFDEITNSFAINDLVKDKSFVSVIQKCPNLKCLQLSYCKINFEIMESIKTCLQLKCLHIDHIFGIDSEEEWTKIGECIGTKLNYLTFNADSLKCDLSRMVSKMSSLKELTLKEYGKDYVSLFSNMGTNVKKLSLINYYNLDDKAIQALNASRLGNKITDLEIFYNKVHTKRSNINGLFQSICHYMSDLKALKFKFLSSPNIEPLFQLKSLVDLSIHFSLSRLIDIEPNTPLNKLKNLILSQVIFTPRRMYAMVKAFPNLEKLSISGKANSGNIDSAVFCCECDAQDKYEDTCFVCYKSCSLALTQFNELKTLQLSYIKMKYSLALVFPFIFKIETISLKPYQCKCGLSIIQSCIKIAESKPIYLEIKESFISEALEGKELPENFRIIKLK